MYVTFFSCKRQIEKTGGHSKDVCF